MPQVVQAKCPHCENVLRIPAEWLSQPMRCKHCQKTFQAKSKSEPAMAKPVGAKQPVPVGQPATAVQTAPAAPPPKAPSNEPFSFDDEPSAPKVARRRSGGVMGLLLLMGTFFCLFLFGAGGTGFVVYKIVMMPGNPGKNGIVKNDDGKTDGNHTRDKIDDAGAKDKDPITKDNKDGPPPISDNGKKDDKKPPFTDVVKKDKNGKKPPPFASGPYPRRALLISINNYLMFNTVHYGSPADSFKNGYPGSSTTVLRDRLSRLPLNFPVSQVIELSDGIPPETKSAKAHSTQKSVIETTIRDFVDTSRAQDRIMIFFAGHAINIDDKSYLVPIDGNKKEVESLVPLKWVYDQLAKCQAQQKILVLDVFRYSPSRGFELPSAGEGEEGKMPEAFDKDLQNPPAGVQVWCSCQKEESSIELDGGSAFYQALCHALTGSAEMTGFSSPAEPIPIDLLVSKVNLKLKELVSADKRTQTSKLTGKAGTASVAYNKDEPLPPTLALKPPTAPGGEAAGYAQVNGILDELRLLPPVRDTRAGDLNLLRAQNLPAFGAKKLDPYKVDNYQNLLELQKRYKANKDSFTKEFPLRAAYFDAVEALMESSKLSMRETLSSPVDPKRKAAFLQEQAPLGISVFKLEQVLNALKAAGEMRDMETSKRWHANFDYTQARLQSRLVYLLEYNYTLGQIRNDNLPELAQGQTGWRVGVTGLKINVPEKKAKDYAKANVGLWKKIEEGYPGTPWAILAQRESSISLGLAWRAKAD